MKDALPPDPPRTDESDEPDAGDTRGEGMKGALTIPVADDDAAAAAEQPKM